jgi:hypothetical protein
MPATNAMSFGKRLRILYAALTQQWTFFTCACGEDVWVSDRAGRLLDGQQCDACEAKAFAVWEKDFTSRQQKGAA